MKKGKQTEEKKKKEIIQQNSIPTVENIKLIPLKPEEVLIQPKKEATLKTPIISILML